MDKKPSYPITIALLFVLVLGVGCSSAQPTDTSSGGNAATPVNSATANTVTIQGSSFSPSTITVAKGDTVTWVNNDTYTHHVASDTAGAFDLGDQSNGASSSHTFDKTGTFKYHCTIHTSMKGTVIVK